MRFAVGFERFARGLAVGHVEGEKAGFAALGFDSAADFLGLRPGGAAVYDDVVARIGKGERDGAPDPAGASRHENGSRRGCIGHG